MIEPGRPTEGPTEGWTRAWLIAGAGFAALCAASPASAESDGFEMLPERPVRVADATVLPPVRSPKAAVRTLPAPPAPFATTSASPDDGLGETGFYLEADTVIQDDKAKAVTAEGGVEVRYRGRVMRAERLTYSQASGVVEAEGNVQIVNPDGTAEFARKIVLDDDLAAGVAVGFSARLDNNVKIAAATAIRRSRNVHELNRVIYTPCDICKADGAPKTPSWSVEASQAVQDGDRRIVYYRNAIIRIAGVPVLYAPVFWHADPTAGRQSGLLAPRLSFSQKRGASYEQPYYLTLSKSQDLVLSPMVSTKINPFLNGQWRKLFAKGELDARFGYTYESVFDNSGDPIPGSNESSRSYILASGKYRFAPDWTLGFAAERVSDDLLFDRYDIPSVYEKRGLYATDTLRLQSQLYAVRQDQSSYLSISTLAFQGLQLGDANAAFPVVAPLIEARWAPQSPILGGRLKLAGSAVVLTRENQPTAPNLQRADSRRLTAEGDWRRTFTLSNGIRVEPFLMGRVDGYSVDGLGTVSGGDDTALRTVSAAGAEVTWPFIGYSGSTTTIIEPIAQFIVSPQPDLNPNIPNQDTADLSLDETNLFDVNRAPGFDIYDAGRRMNLGARASFYWGGGGQARVLVGKSFRDGSNPLIPLQAGYRRSESDWVVAASATPVGGLSLYGRGRLAPDDLQIVRIETGASVALPWVQGYARYLNDRSDPTVGTLQTVEVAANVFVAKNWGFTVAGQRDLDSTEWTRRDFGLVYRDECTRIEVIYQKEAGSPRLGGPSESIQVRLTLATLGDPGYRPDF